MKKLSLILFTLCLSTFLFAQSTKSHSSISVSQTDNAYSMKASFSENLSPKVEEKLMAVLGKENAQSTKKGWLWKKENQGKEVYAFLLGKRKFEATLQEDFLEHTEYQDLIDLCKTLKAIMGSPDKAQAAPKECSDRGLSININGNPVEMKVDDEVFILQAHYTDDRRAQITEKIEQQIGSTTSDSERAVSRWTKMENGKRLYQFSVSNTTCDIYIDKTRLPKSEWQPLQQLGFSIAGAVFNH